jgi:hypothetical protein
VKPTTQKLDKQEAREILEELARTGPPTARVAAIRVLLRLDAEEEKERPAPSPFDLLDPPEIAARRREQTEAAK